MLKRDAIEYHVLAKNLVAEHRFSFPEGDPDAQRRVVLFQVETTRTPLYPLFIGVVYSVLGMAPWAVLMAQLVVDTLSCALLFSILNRLFNEHVASWSAFFYAFDPTLILFSNTLYGETLLVLLCILGFHFLSKGLGGVSGKGGMGTMLAAGFFFGLATLTKPSAQFLPLIIAALLIISKRRVLKRAVPITMAFLLSSVFTVSPWIVRNYLHFGVLALSTSGAYNMIACHGAPVEAQAKDQTTWQALQSLLASAERDMIEDGLHPEALNDFKRAPYWVRTALRVCVEHPLISVKRQVFGIALFFGAIGRKYRDQLFIQPDDVAPPPERTAVAHTLADLYCGACLFLVYVASFIGLVTAWRDYDHRPLWVCIAVVVYFAFVVGTLGQSRLRVPAIPFYLSFAGIGAHQVELRLKKDKNHET